MKDIDVPALVPREIEGQECICTYKEAVNYLLNSCATEKVISKATSKIESLMKFPNQTTIQFAKTLEGKALLCGPFSPNNKPKEYLWRRILS